MVAVELASALTVDITAAMNPARTMPRNPQDGASVLENERECQVHVFQGLAAMHHVNPVVHDEPEKARHQGAQQVDEAGKDDAHDAVPSGPRAQDALAPSPGSFPNRR